MENEKIERLDKVSLLKNGREDDKHLSAIFSTNSKNTALSNQLPTILIDIAEFIFFSW